MNKVFGWPALGALLSFGLTFPGVAAQSGTPEETTAAAERLLGSDSEDSQARAYLPFTRQIGVSGTVTGSFATSATAAGVPASTMLDALRAFGALIDLDRDIQDGDSFYVRYEQSFTVEGQAIGVGRVLWAELNSTPKGTIALHRFRPSDGAERFWFASGDAAPLPSIALPLDVVNISSGFGPRANPMRASPGKRANKVSAMGPLPKGGWRLGLSPVLMMHDGIDLAAPSGTPVHAAADGLVLGARPNGGYGNWIKIAHEGDLATVYGHLSRFAPGIKPGTWVSQGDLIGFTGNTGRSTGPHLHFELQSNDKPVDPIARPDVGRSQLSGLDLERFEKQVTAELAERDRENALSSFGF